jgi:CBS domain-containing protein
MSVADILHRKGHEIVKAMPTDTVQSAVAKLAHNRIGAVIVEDARMRPVGIFSERDFVNATAAHGAAALAMPLERLMSTSLITCQPADAVDTAMATMTRAKIRHLPVVNQGRLVGIVSIGDLVKHRLDEKELEAGVLLDLTRMRA